MEIAELIGGVRHYWCLVGPPPATIPAVKVPVLGGQNAAAMSLAEKLGGGSRAAEFGIELPPPVGGKRRAMAIWMITKCCHPKRFLHVAE